MKQRARGSWSIRRGAKLPLVLVAGLTLAVAAGVPTAAGNSSAPSTGSSADPTADISAGQHAKASKALWDRVAKTPRAVTPNKVAEVRPTDFEVYDLDRAGMRAALEQEPLEDTLAAASSGLEIALPAPDGGFQRFLLQEAPVMAPALARAHPGITTYEGVGVDDPAATIRADLTPLGFHASVRSPDGGWYVEPYYHLDQSVYVSYFVSDADNPHQEEWVESVLGSAPTSSALAAASGGPTVGTDLRTYRLALLSNPGYATYHGGPQNVTAAKVTLMNRVTQIYEDDTSIRMVLVANNDLLNLDTPAQMTEPNGPCGSAACFTTAQSTSCSGSTLNRNRIVIGQLLGATDYDIGHIILGNPGGGVASLNSVGGNAKAQGCTGLTAPTGDFFAVDYVAHEMGHQFGGPHTFNGVVSNCSGGNRSAASSVEPGSGSSIMAYAGICGTDNLQPHSDPYWSQRSLTEISTFVTSDRPAINEVQNISLRGFDTDGDSFRIGFSGGVSEPIVRGVNYSTAGLKAAIEGMPGWPAG